MKRTRYFLAGVLVGAVLFGGSVAYAAGVIAERSINTIYIDGKQVELEAYSINGSNYLKLRDVGKAVGFNVYWDGAVQIDTASPYTGEAPSAPASEIRVNCSHGNTIPAGERRGLIISPSGTNYTVSSSDPTVLDIESVMGFWAAVAKAPGTATITVTAPDGQMGRVAVTVNAAGPAQPISTDRKALDLNANAEIREEMIRLINGTRKANGASELSVNAALMDAAQDCSAQGFTEHENQYECEAGLAYGYPYGFGSNFTMFTTGETPLEIAQHAVNNWINSPGHFQTMIDPRGDCIGVGITVDNGKATCFMFVGDPNSHNPYE